MPTIGNIIIETASGTGTGNLTLAAYPYYRRFSSAFGTGSGNPFYYCVRHRSADQYEVGLGYMNDTNTLVRDTVLESSNANALVDFSAGDKDCINDIPASLQTINGVTYTGATASVDLGAFDITASTGLFSSLNMYNTTTANYGAVVYQANYYSFTDNSDALTDIQASGIYNDSTLTIDLNNSSLIEGGSSTVAAWNGYSGNLYCPVGVATPTVFNSVGYAVVDATGHRLKDDAGSPVLDFGVYATYGVAIYGGLSVDSIFGDINPFVSFGSGGDVSILTKSIIDGSSVDSVDPLYRLLKTSGAAERFDWELGLLYKTDTSVVLDIETGVLTGEAATVAAISGLVTAGTGISVSGSGTTVDPIVVENTGSGSFTPTFNYYTSSTTLSDPGAGCSTIRITGIGGGGGGGSGRRAASLAARGGGAGGSAGAFFDIEIAYADVPSWPVTITIGASGTGGAAQTGTGNGNPGSDGGDTSFGSIIVGKGGKGGAGGTSTTSIGGEARFGSIVSSPPLLNAVQPAGGQGNAGNTSVFNGAMGFAGSGAGANGSSAVNAVSAGATGGSNQKGDAGGTGGSGAAGSNGTDGDTSAPHASFGGTGGGGAGGSNTTALVGGNGGNYGAGGGGGNNGTVGVHDSGKGGDGAAGFMKVICR